jgi:hypothetical protein
MAHFLKNRSKKHAHILQRQVEPQASICLEDVFEGFCKPKVASKDDRKKLDIAEQRGVDAPGIRSEYSPDDFDLFLEKAKEMAKDQAIWEFWTDDKVTTLNRKNTPRKIVLQNAESDAAAQPAVATGKKGSVKSQAIQKKDIKRKLPSESEWTPQELARLPYNEDTKKLINDIGSDKARSLKAALKLVRHLPGQERTRKLIEDKIADLGRD